MHEKSYENRKTKRYFPYKLRCSLFVPISRQLNFIYLANEKPWIKKSVQLIPLPQYFNFSQPSKLFLLLYLLQFQNSRCQYCKFNGKRRDILVLDYYKDTIFIRLIFISVKFPITRKKEDIVLFQSIFFHRGDELLNSVEGNEMYKVNIVDERLES